MFCKTQSNKLLFCCKNLRKTARWITLALTPEAAATLRAEPHLMGEIDNFRSKYCGAYPESQCCVHYRGLEWKSDVDNPGYLPLPKSKYESREAFLANLKNINETDRDKILSNWYYHKLLHYYHHNHNCFHYQVDSLIYNFKLITKF